jgi:hypothetical protein
MARHWWVAQPPGWRRRMLINGAGGLVTAIVTLVIAVTKFVHGAWIVILVIPLVVLGFRLIHGHYREIAHDLSLEGLAEEPPVRNTVLVPVSDLHRGVVRALRFAETFAAAPRAVYVEIDSARTGRLKERWATLGLSASLVVLPSPYRSVLGPLLDYIDTLQRHDPAQLITIVIPEFVPRRWWHHLLHNQTALAIKGALLFRRGIVVVDVPFHLSA